MKQKIFLSLTSFVFLADLSAGSFGQDVFELQRFLNRDSETAVSQTGDGSFGQETQFFGNLTKEAVIKFQEKHKKDVLDPAGLEKGTGFVGFLTRQKINSLLTSDLSTDQSKQSNQTNLLPNQKNNTYNNYEDYLNGVLKTYGSNSVEVEAFFLSETALKKGQEVILHGYNIDENTKLYIDGFIVENGTKASSSVQMQITIPKDIEIGKHFLYLEKNNIKSRQIDFEVISNDTQPPFIDSIDKDIINFGTEINIKGKNFGESVDIYTPIAVFSASSTNTEIKTIIPKPSTQLNLKEEQIMNCFVQVKAKGGTSNVKRLKCQIK